jgi:hypothetical protein
MNCRDVDLVLIENSKSSYAQLPVQIQTHIMNCQACQDFLRALDPVAVPPSPSILRGIETTLMADLRPVRPLWPQSYFLAGLALIFLLIVGVSVSCLGAGGVSAMGHWQLGTVLCSLTVSAWLLADSLVRQMAPGSEYGLKPQYLPAAVIVWLLLIVVAVFPIQREGHWVSEFICLAVGTSFALVAGLLFWLLLRRGAFLTPRLTGASVGLMAGLVGTSILEIHCPNIDAWHVLVSHLGVAMLAAGVGMGMGVSFEIFRSHRRSQSIVR